MSKLKEMAAAGDPWAVATLAKAQAQSRAAARRGAAIQRARQATGHLYDGDEPPWAEAPVARPKDPAFAEAMRDARDIREWTHGSRVAPWLVYRLAQALHGGRHGD